MAGPSALLRRHRTPETESVFIYYFVPMEPGPFPEAERALLEVLGGLPEEATHLDLRGTYRPPLGRVGEVLDRALLHRVAELSVKTFVDRVAAAIAERMALSRKKG